MTPPRLGLGTWAVGGTGWGPPTAERERVAAIRRAFDRGVRIFDTAPTYGDSEELLGRALGRRWEAVEIATKVGPRDDPRRSLEASLRRLGTDHVDLFQLHEVLEGYERSLEAMHELLNEGKTRALGLCNARPGEILRAIEIVPLQSYQGPYNLFDRDAEHLQLPVCREHGLAFLAYRPLASGLLGGRIEGAPRFSTGDHRSRIYWFRDRELARRLSVIERLGPVADRRGTSLSALALGWVMSRPGVSVVLAGARTPAQVDENVVAAERTLSGNEVDEVDRAVEDAFRSPRATAAARKRAAGLGEREQFIAERLDGRRSSSEIAAEWSSLGGEPMIAGQVRLFADQLVERGLADG